MVLRVLEEALGVSKGIADEGGALRCKKVRVGGLVEVFGGVEAGFYEVCCVADGGVEEVLGFAVVSG